MPVSAEGVSFICEQDGSETYRHFYADTQKLRPFHALPHHERIVRVLETLFGEARFSSTPVTSVTSSSQENISIPLLRIRTSIRFAVRRIRGPCGHR